MADQLKVDEMVPVSIVLAFLLRTFLARRGVVRGKRVVPAHLNAFDLINDYNYDAPSPEDRRLIFRFMRKQRTEQRARQYVLLYFFLARSVHLALSNDAPRPIPRCFFLEKPANRCARRTFSFLTARCTSSLAQTMLCRLVVVLALSGADALNLGAAASRRSFITKVCNCAQLEPASCGRSSVLHPAWPSCCASHTMPASLHHISLAVTSQAAAAAGSIAVTAPVFAEAPDLNLVGKAAMGGKP